METDHVKVESRLLEAVLMDGACALDAGCGRTTRLRAYRDRITRLVGVDVDGAAGSANPFLDEFVPTSLDDRLPFASETFDLVYANFVLEHLTDPRHTLEEWFRVLKPGGHLVIVTSNRRSPFLAVGRCLPQGARLAIKRRGAGAAKEDVYPTVYRINTPELLEECATAARFEPVSLVLVGTIHRYGARVPGAAPTLRMAERALPSSMRSTIVASFRVPDVRVL